MVINFTYNSLENDLSCFHFLKQVCTYIRTKKLSLNPADIFLLAQILRVSLTSSETLNTHVNSLHLTQQKEREKELNASDCPFMFLFLKALRTIYSGSKQ